MGISICQLFVNHSVLLFISYCTRTLHPIICGSMKPDVCVLSLSLSLSLCMSKSLYVSVTWSNHLVVWMSHPWVHSGFFNYKNPTIVVSWCTSQVRESVDNICLLFCDYMVVWLCPSCVVKEVTQMWRIKRIFCQISLVTWSVSEVCSILRRPKTSCSPFQLNCVCLHLLNNLLYVSFLPGYVL